MAENFQPVGDRARWRIAYDLLVKASIGDVVTYEELAGAMSLDDSSGRQIVQAAVRRAAKELLEQNRRAVDVEPNVGYRIVEPSKQLELAHKHRRRAGAQVDIAKSHVDYVDLNGMSPDLRRAFEVTAIGLGALADMTNRIEARQARTEAAVSKASVRIERTEDEVAALRAELERMKASLPEESA